MPSSTTLTTAILPFLTHTPTLIRPLTPLLHRTYSSLNRPRPPPLPKAKQAEWESLIKSAATPRRTLPQNSKLSNPDDALSDEDLLSGFTPEIRDRLLGKTISAAQRAKIAADLKSLIASSKAEGGAAGSRKILRDVDLGLAAEGSLEGKVDVRLDEELSAEDMVKLKEEEEMHPDYRKGAEPEFEGDVNPRTGEVGGPKREPVRKWIEGDWSYNGRATDF